MSALRCSSCGTELGWRICDWCEGTGKITYAILANAGVQRSGDYDLEFDVCSECNGAGGWHVCPRGHKEAPHAQSH